MGKRRDNVERLKRLIEEMKSAPKKEPKVVEELKPAEVEVMMPEVVQEEKKSKKRKKKEESED